MRVLILGASGMLGHKLWQVFRSRFETWGTVRSSYQEYARYGLFEADRLLGHVDTSKFDTVERAVLEVQPTVVVNCIGIIKQLPTARDPIASIAVNALFPHRLAQLSESIGVRLIHISTDCVFSGRKGMYTEDDVPDAEDLYGRSKLLGEVDGPDILTLRTSLIGRELQTSNGLVEWFLSSRGQRVQGYTNAIFSGFPTLVLANIIADVIERHPDLSGVYHVSSAPISKHQLLCLLRDALRVPIEIEPSPTVSVDRSLDSSRFQAAAGYVPPPWTEMVLAMANDPTPYETWRQARAS
jgi:dTDP-4-dehydrorhamnose reductase